MKKLIGEDFLRQPGDKAVLINSGSLMGTRVITSGFGFIFWMATASYFSPEEVGLGSAVISAMMLLGTLGTLGVGTYLIGELPKHKDKKKQLIPTAIAVSGLFSSIISLIFVWIVPGLSSNLDAFFRGGMNSAIFLLGGVLISISIVLDKTSIGLLRGMMQFWRNLISSIVRVLAIVLFGCLPDEKNGLMIIGSVILGIISSLPLTFSSLVESFRGISKYFSWRILKEMVQLSFWHQIINVALQSHVLLLPLVVSISVSVKANAFYYTSVMIAGFVFVIPVALSTVLFAIISKNPGSMQILFKRFLRISFIVSVVGVIFLFFNAAWILNFFGNEYVTNGLWPLRILAIGVFPLTIKVFFVTVYRLINKTRHLALVITYIGLGELILSTIGGLIGGVVGLCAVWTLALFFQTGFYIPALKRVVSHKINIK